MKQKITQALRKNGNFFLNYLQFKKFFSRQKIRTPHVIHNQAATYVIVMPWLGTSVPWYAIAMALLLYKNGKNVSILFDDMLFGDDIFFHKLQAKLILKTLKKIKLKFIKLSDFHEIPNSSVDIEHLTRLNSIHYTHGETNCQLRKSYEVRIRKQLTKTYLKVDAFYHKEKPAQIILPGGIWGNSGVFANLAKNYNVRLSSYDCGESLLLFSIFGIASQLQDIPYAFKYILEKADERLFAKNKGLVQLEKRRAGNDIYNHFLKQANTSNIGHNYYLILLNSVWDSAALGLHTAYNSMIEWILDSIEWVITKTDKTIIIRQHPAEREDAINNSDSYLTHIENRFGKNKRIIYICAKEKTNTYDLIEKSSCVLGFSSTSIVESVILHKPAIIVSSAYYADFGIVFNAKSKGDYYKYLQKASEDKLEVTQEMVDRACICNYLTQTCNWYKTEFTPNSYDFLKWRKRTLDELGESYLPIQSLVNDMPISLLQHQKLIQGRT